MSLNQYNLYTAQCIGFALLIFRFSTGEFPTYTNKKGITTVIENLIGNVVSWSLHGRDGFPDHLDKAVKTRIEEVKKQVKDFEKDFEDIKKCREATVLQRSEAPSQANSAMGSTITLIVDSYIGE